MKEYAGVLYLNRSGVLYLSRSGGLGGYFKQRHNMNNKHGKNASQAWKQ